MDDQVAAMEGCRFLFLSEIQELNQNGLRVVVSEGIPVGEESPVQVGGTAISGGTLIEVSAESNTFELIWNEYVVYSVLNESYANCDDEERYNGHRFRVYSKSSFIEYASRASFASADYPGPTQHFGIVCENHLVNVISTAPPTITATRRRFDSYGSKQHLI